MRSLLALARGALAALPVLLTGLAAAIPVISSTVKAVRAGWMPAGDDGIIATRGWDVLTTHTPLVGQYSEAGLVLHGQIMHSPGPMLYWLLALPARFGSVASLAVMMGALNTLAIIGCVAIARRRGGLVLMLASALGIALMCQSLPSESLHDIWNPAAGLFPFLLLLFAGWSLACGDFRLLPLVALLWSFVVQTHLMYLAPSTVVLAVALLWSGAHWIAPRLRGRRGDRGDALAAQDATRRVWPWALAALLVLAACWSAPAVQEIEESPGNLTTIVRTLGHRGATLGARPGWRAVVRAVGERPWWLYVPASEWERKRDVLAAPSSGQEASAIVLLAALALVCIGAALRRRPDVSAAALIGLGLCGALLAQVSANPSSTMLEETLGYTLWWGSELGLWAWLVLAWAAWLVLARLVRALLQARVRALVGRVPRALAGPRTHLRWHGRVRPKVGAAGALAVIFASALGAGAVAAVGGAVAATAKPDSHIYEYRPISAIASGIERLVPGGQTIYFRLGALDLGTQPMEPPLRFLLVRHGDRVLAPFSYPRLGSYYTLGHRTYQWIVYLGDGIRPRPHMTLAARVRFRDPWGTDVLSAWVRRAPHAGH
jgi:hypothetical protein